MDNSELMAARYGGLEVPGGLADPVIERMLAHKSVRDYTGAPVSEAALEAIVAAAQSASTSSGLQTWSLVTLRGADDKDRLAALCGNQRHIRSCDVFMVWVADLSRIGNVARRKGIEAAGTDYLELFLVACIDAALAAQNAAVAAEALGLGIVYIGAIRNNPREVSALLDLPEKTFAVFGMCLGHPDPDTGTEIKPRIPQSMVWHRDRYDTALDEAVIDRYDEMMGDFYTRQRMKGREWSEHSARRIAGPESLNGRDVLRAHLAALGFPLK